MTILGACVLCRYLQRISKALRWHGRCAAAASAVANLFVLATRNASMALTSDVRFATKDTDVSRVACFGESLCSDFDGALVGAVGANVG